MLCIKKIPCGPSPSSEIIFEHMLTHETIFKSPCHIHIDTCRPTVISTFVVVSFFQVGGLGWGSLRDGQKSSNGSAEKVW